MIASTSHGDIDAILAELAAGASEIAGDRLAALWLTGSLTYGDFDRGSSDIDYLAVLSEPLSDDVRRFIAFARDHIPV